MYLRFGRQALQLKRDGDNDAVATVTIAAGSGAWFQRGQDHHPDGGGRTGIWLRRPPSTRKRRDEKDAGPMGEDVSRISQPNPTTPTEKV
jgi:hypothetical protein